MPAPIARHVEITPAQATLVRAAMAAQEAATARVQAILDTLVAGREEIDGLLLTGVVTEGERARLVFGGVAEDDRAG